MTTDNIFKGQTVVVFSLPGAYTPTCSSTHLPRYNELARIFRENGVDQIICLSVNDAFVMNEWRQDQEAENITLLPDGNGEFTAGMGMLVDKSNLGFGNRSLAWALQARMTVAQMRRMPFYHPTIEEGLRTALRDLDRDLRAARASISNAA